MTDAQHERATPTRAPFAWRPVTLVAAAVTALLLATSAGYDYHRDELYFRLLGQHPAWGYVDQPPFTPLLARASTAVFGDTAWALRVPAALLVAVTAVLLALIAREAGGGRTAQVLAALGTAGGFPLVAGHLLLTVTPDLVVWSLVILGVLRALLHDRPRAWLAVGLVTGLGLYNKHLIVLLLLTVAAGLLLAGPRRVLLSPWLWAGVGLALLVGAPNLVYQATHDFPQLRMAGALAEHKGSEARILLLPLQFVLVGAALVAVWVAGLVELWRGRAARALAVAYPLMLVLLFVTAGQFYYTLGLVTALYAVGCVPTARWLADRRGRRALLGAAVLSNVAASVVIMLPVIPVDRLGATPVPDANQAARDQVGWRTYVAQIADVYAALPADDRARAIVLTSNYGEAGAVDRYGPARGLPTVYSGHNELYHLRRPPESATVAVAVFPRNAGRLGAFANCAEAGELDNGVGVDNEEQGVVISVCRGPVAPWSALWPGFQHLS
ncbi:glycosyltransferase family 39 protein [Longispora sp. K20-0274]|uniref:glycosyltransferase family 39 protein n=1 Tax=Longispora sp. K20-0274 TaxID=3088255 RepID=UPI00399B440B